LVRLIGVCTTNDTGCEQDKRDKGSMIHGSFVPAKEARAGPQWAAYMGSIGQEGLEDNARQIILMF
jgi:hypothetical protein